MKASIENQPENVWLECQDWGPPRKKDDFRRNKYIIEELRSIYGDNPFTVLDLACGLANILSEISAIFPNSSCSGVDVVDYEERYPGRYAFLEQKVQDFIRETDKEFDVVIMLESYRNWDWETGDKLKRYGGKFRNEFDNWVRRHAKHFIFTGDSKWESRSIGKDDYFDILICDGGKKND